MSNLSAFRSDIEAIELELEWLFERSQARESARHEAGSIWYALTTIEPESLLANPSRHSPRDLSAALHALACENRADRVRPILEELTRNEDVPAELRDQAKHLPSKLASSAGRESSERTVEWFTGKVDQFEGDVCSVTLVDSKMRESETKLPAQFFLGPKVDVGRQFFYLLKEGRDTTTAVLVLREPQFHIVADILANLEDSNDPPSLDQVDALARMLRDLKSTKHCEEALVTRLREAIARTIRFQIPASLRASRDAFAQALPELLKDPKQRGKWVCFCGDVRVGIADDDEPLINECLRRGLKADQYIVDVIEPKAPALEEVDFPLLVAMIILDRLPIPEQDTTVEGPDGSPFLGPDGRPVVAKRYQVLVWISLSAKDEVGWEPGRPRFLAIMDMGLNHNFSITREH